ncbi:hypothetical protein J2858_001897 [Neorhizobium galegae]|uniref:hypothetical protein n=1 Tax=Neorhizobium galegae TaxID=399 RepID=UPI001AEB30A1|nr:hypothetical protein [Neorhizobium galegae]MBP2548981.1 hypothetical protein [Neorhizobium galegae]
MLFRFIDNRTMDETAWDATGTFADGVHPIIRQKDNQADQGMRMRSSYARDLVAARRLADLSPVFH